MKNIAIISMQFILFYRLPLISESLFSYHFKIWEAITLTSEFIFSILAVKIFIEQS